MTYTQRYNKFRQSRIAYWQPKLTKALNTIADNILQQPTIDAALLKAYSVQPTEELASIIKSLYIDAGRVMGAYAYQDVMQQVRKRQEQKRLAPIGFNEQLINDIIQYYQTNLLTEAVLPISDTLRDYILLKLIEAQREGLSLTEVATAIEEAGMVRKRAFLIARTETVKAANYGAKKGAQATGYPMNKVWVSAQQSRTRRIPRDKADHLHMNGKEVAMDEPFNVPDVTGVILMDRPGDSGSPARQVVNCRCVLAFKVLDQPSEVIAPKKKEFIPAKDIKEAKQRAADMLKDRYGLNIDSVRADKSMSLDVFNKRLQQLDKLSDEYEVSRIYNKSKPIKLSFNSTSKYEGVIVSQNTGTTTTIHEINFGHQVSAKARTFDPEATGTRRLSRVDKENMDISTMTHEFAHFITTDHQEITSLYGDNRIIPFWKELRQLRKEYNEEYKAVYDTKDWNKINQFSLGQYSGLNANEFMAEAFAEFKLSSNPSPYAIKTGRLIDKYFKK